MRDRSATSPAPSSHPAAVANAARALAALRDVAIVALLGWIAGSMPARHDPAPPGSAPAETPRAVSSDAVAELQAAATELRAAVRALAQQAAPVERARVEPAPASAPQAPAGDGLPPSAPRGSGHAGLNALAGHVAPKQDAAIKALLPRLQDPESEKAIQHELWFSSPARIVERFGMPDVLIHNDQSFHMRYYTEKSSILFTFADGVLIGVSGS